MSKQALLLLCLLCLGAPPMVSAASKGDLRLDGQIDAADVLVLDRALRGDLTLTAEQEAAADVAPLIDGEVTPDGTVDLGDLVILRRAIGGRDVDGDGLSARVEARLSTSPLSRDSDGDGTTDADEDSDADLLTNIEELGISTDPANPDTDGDGVLDGVELANGLDPNDPRSNNNPPVAPTLAVSQVQQTQLSGTVAACSDDGLPDPPGICTVIVLVVPANELCTSPPVKSAPSEPGGNWRVADLAYDTSYEVYAQANDGSATTCSPGTSVTTKDNLTEIHNPGTLPPGMTFEWCTPPTPKRQYLYGLNAQGGDSCP